MITKKVFSDMAIFMIGFGAVIGIIFPFFVAITGVPGEMVLTPTFFILCISAGIIVGLVNIFLAKKIVGKKLITLSTHMKKVEAKLNNITRSQNITDCADDKCMIAVDSEDEIGESAQAFNSLVKSLSNAFKLEIEVRDFTEMLSSYLELEKLAQESLNQLMRNLNAQAGAVILEDSGEITLLSSYGIKSPQSILDSDLIWKVIKTKERVVVEIPEDIEITGILTDFRPKSVIVEPILYKDAMLGAVVLGASHSISDSSFEDIGLFGRGLALAFKNAITHDQLQRLAANDPLTGILNRRFGMTRLNDEFARSIRSNSPLGVIMFDIDHFKKINDTYGHLIGDKVLIKLTQVSKEALREGDVFVRYGGEEFLIVMPGASTSDVFNIAEKLRHLVEDFAISHKSQIIKITISLGGVSYPDYSAKEINELIGAADRNLYRAKNEGRNKTIIT